MSPRFLYLHGFASGPSSKKGLALGEHFARRGARLERLDLRVPSLEHLRLSAILEAVGSAIGGPHERVVLIGSSLGGLAAARRAEDDARVCALILLAPAFRLGERWRQRLGGEALRLWQESGFLPIVDHTTGGPARVDFGFLADLDTVDARSGGWPDARVPTLIVHGRADDTVPVEASREYARGKRHVRLVEVDDGHELTASLPRIAVEIDRFLEPFLGAF